MASIFWNAVVSSPFPVSDGRMAVTIKWIGEDRKRSRGTTTTRARYVMMRHLNRLLDSDEIVEHKDGDFMNDDISNLELIKGGRTSKQAAHDALLPTVAPWYKPTNGEATA
jgi:hypothetical protein